MAQKVHIVLEDDLDGGDADETVTFGLDGTTYEIDLSDENAAAFRDSLANYIAHGRRVTGGRRSGGAKKSTASSAGGGPSAKDIRDWARSQGQDVSDRGRVSAELREAYEAAH